MSIVVTPVRSSPARIARSTGAAPRQRGSSEKWTFTHPTCGHREHVGRQDRAVGDDDDRVRSERREPLGLARADASVARRRSRARPRPTLHRRGFDAQPAPSRFVRTRVRRDHVVRAASARRVGTAASGVPMKTTRIDALQTRRRGGRPGRRAFAPFADDRRALRAAARGRCARGRGPRRGGRSRAAGCAPPCRRRRSRPCFPPRREPRTTTRCARGTG